MAINHLWKKWSSTAGDFFFLFGICNFDTAPPLQEETFINILLSPKGKKNKNKTAQSSRSCTAHYAALITSVRLSTPFYPFFSRSGCVARTALPLRRQMFCICRSAVGVSVWLIMKRGGDGRKRKRSRYLLRGTADSKKSDESEIKMSPLKRQITISSLNLEMKRFQHSRQN